MAWATLLAFTGMLLALVGAQLLSDAVPAGNRYRGNGALVLLLFGALATLTAAWALLALRFGSARHPALGTLAAGVAALLLAFPADVISARNLPETTLVAPVLLATAIGVGLARQITPPTPPVLLTGLAALLLQIILLIASGSGATIIWPLALPLVLVAPLMAALLARPAARWRLVGWLAAGGLLAVPGGLIGGYAAGILLVQVIKR